MNKIIKVFLLLMCTTSIFSCAKGVPPTITVEKLETSTPPASRTTEEAEVYSHLLNKDPKRYIGNSPTIIVLKETEIELSGLTDYYEKVLKDLPKLSKETLVNYREVNKQKQAIQSNLILYKPYEILSSDEIYKREIEDPEWFRTYTITTFSGIGFNSTFDQALVYMQHDCGGECATGDWYFLILYKNKWIIESILEGWVS